MSLNVLTRNRKWGEVIKSIREASPDFLILMEVDSVWQQVCEQELGDDYPHIAFAGDLNLSPWSPNFKRVIDTGNLVDSAKPFGPTPTWYIFPTWIAGLKIDHVLTSDEVSVQQVEIGHDVGSDHRAVIVDFDF